MYSAGDALSVECSFSQEHLWRPLKDICRSNLFLKYLRPDVLKCSIRSEMYDALRQEVHSNNPVRCRLPVARNKAVSYVNFTLLLEGTLEEHTFYIPYKFNMIIHDSNGIVDGVSFYALNSDKAYFTAHSDFNIVVNVYWVDGTDLYDLIRNEDTVPKGKFAELSEYFQNHPLINNKIIDLEALHGKSSVFWLALCSVLLFILYAFYSYYNRRVQTYRKFV